MKVSLNTVKQYINFDLPPVDELVASINQQLGGVEEVVDLGKKYQGIVIVKVVECSPLEGSDHLNVTKVDDGGVVQGVERDENGLVQVVCGAPNVHADMYAVWLSPGVTVPESFEDDEPFVLSAKPLRGVVSNGMLASPKELAFGDSHEGILEIDPSEWKPNMIEIKPGTDFAEVYGLNDTVIDIENKMFTHRPDLFGVLGVAREIAGISRQPFTSPDWYRNEPQFGNSEGLNLNVSNDIPEKVPRFVAVVVKDVTVKPSPVWLQAELVRLGSKPINNIVDVTNYVMLLTGQPMHAYDYDKVATGKLGVRLAHAGEELVLLGGKKVELDAADIIITNGEKPIGLAGVMGGAETEVSAETKNIILECANFDMYTIRRTTMRHGIFTDAATRFTKGQSPLQNSAVMSLALMSVFDTAGGIQASAVIDESASLKERIDTVHIAESLEITATFINERLGSNLSNDDIRSLLENVEIKVDGDDSNIKVYAPYWRTDIEIPEDIVEEVGRLYGFDKLPQELPARTLRPVRINKGRVLKQQLREILSRAGANEVLTYSFVHRNLLERAGQDPDDTYQLSNALSPDLHYMRRSLLPSLLDKVHPNVKSGYDHFAIFEIGKGHKKSAGFDNQGVPIEQQFLSLALAGGDFYQAKALTEFVADHLNLEFEYMPIENGKLFEPKRGALIKAGDTVIGAVGEFRAVIKRNFKLPDVSAGFEIDFDKLLDLSQQSVQSYKPLGKFPSAQRDITLRSSRQTTYADIKNALTEALAQTNLDSRVEPLGIYQPDDGDTKNTTLRITLESNDKTLTGEEVQGIMESIASHIDSKLGATVV